MIASKIERARMTILIKKVVVLNIESTKKAIVKLRCNQWRHHQERRRAHPPVRLRKSLATSRQRAPTSRPNIAVASRTANNPNEPGGSDVLSFDRETINVRMMTASVAKDVYECRL